jgi:hypothetical protein
VGRLRLGSAPGPGRPSTPGGGHSVPPGLGVHSARQPRPRATPIHAGCDSAQTVADAASPRGKLRPRRVPSNPQAQPATRSTRSQVHEAWVGPWPGRDDCALRPPRAQSARRPPRPPADPCPPDAARLVALPVGPSRPTRGRSGPGPLQLPSPPRTPSARPAAPPPSSPRARPKPLRPPPHSPSPATAFRLPLGSAKPQGARLQAPPHAVSHAKPSVRETSTALRPLAAARTSA